MICLDSPRPPQPGFLYLVNMKLDQSPVTLTHREALWLNGTAWALLALGGLGVFLLWGSPVVLVPLLLMPLVSALGTAANLFLALRSFVRGKQQQAWLYLLGFLLLAVCLRAQLWWVTTYIE